MYSSFVYWSSGGLFNKGVFKVKPPYSWAEAFGDGVATC